LPSADDFRVQLGSREVNRIRRQIEASTRQAMDDAMHEVYGRIFKVVEHMATRLRAYTVTADGVQNTFRDSLVENVRELVDVLPALNINNDPRLTDVISHMRDNLLTYSGDVLRDSAAARIETAQAAEAILKSVSDFMA